MQTQQRLFTGLQVWHTFGLQTHFKQRVFGQASTPQVGSQPHVGAEQVGRQHLGFVTQHGLRTHFGFSTQGAAQVGSQPQVGAAQVGAPQDGMPQPQPEPRGVDIT